MNHAFAFISVGCGLMPGLHSADDHRTRLFPALSIPSYKQFDAIAALLYFGIAVQRE
jgi:hypothetical protein